VTGLRILNNLGERYERVCKTGGICRAGGFYRSRYGYRAGGVFVMKHNLNTMIVAQLVMIVAQIIMLLVLLGR
jgi:hypothetical protein